MAESKEGDLVCFVWAGDRPTAKFMTAPSAYSSATASAIAITTGELNQHNVANLKITSS
jgi:hypothetical protein